MATATMYLSLLNQADDVISRVRIQAPDGGEQLEKFTVGTFITLDGERCEIIDRLEDEIPELFVKPFMAQSPPIRYQ